MTIEISADEIEGIHLKETDVDSPEGFWSNFQYNGWTYDSFLEIASHIPLINAEIQKGRSLDEIEENIELSDCVNIYFRDKPRVIENNGYYEFEGNGRHRILAAMGLNLKIPVEVVGRRDRSVFPQSNSIQESDKAGKGFVDKMRGFFHI